MTPGTPITTPTGHHGTIIRTENTPYGRIVLIRLRGGGTEQYSAGKVQVTR